LCAEPDAQVDVTEDASSVGSIYSWKGKVVGEGEIEHRDLEPGSLIEEEIRFVKPFRSKSQVSFEFEPVGDGTKITWHMRGSLPWFLFWMRSQMEVFIGMDYERGLRMLKEWLETGQILSETKVRGIESVGPLKMAGVRKTCAISEIGPSMEEAFSEATEKFKANELSTETQTLSVYHDFDIKAQTFDYTSGYVVSAATESVPGLSMWSLPASKAFCVEHIGSYEHLGNAWSAAHQITRYEKMKLSKAGGYEVYRNSPQDTAPAELRTEIYLPLK
jgi:effector-binding domain-containing protein